MKMTKTTRRVIELEGAECSDLYGILCKAERLENLTREQELLIIAILDKW